MRPQLLVSVLFCLLLAACGIAVPEDKREWVGTWRDDHTVLMIHANGTVNYQRKEGSTSVNINAPIQAFEGNSFDVGVGLITTRFDVQEPPQEVDGVWRMRVDGRWLTREANKAANPDA